MKTEIKSGKQILDEFFLEAKSMSDVDENVIDKIIDLHETGKLSDRNLANALLEMREKSNNE